MGKKVLIIGSGGREHVLGWKLKQSSIVEKIYFAPGNAGTQEQGENIPLKISDFDNLLKFAKEKKIDLTVVGPELPLSLGIVDLFTKEKLAIFGPCRQAALIETSKVWQRKFLKKIGVPSPNFVFFQNPKEALSYVSNQPKCVVKADGLAGGKGTIVCLNKKEAKKAISKIMINRVFGEAGKKIVIEEFLDGEEASVIAFCDGEKYHFLPSARDYKRLKEGNRGLNTGGMGAFAPSPFLTKKDLEKIGKSIFQPVLVGFKKIGISYKGILYAGLMITKNGIKVLEFNCRFGDPETQVQLPLLKSDLYQILLACINGELEKTKIAWSKKYCVTVVLASKGYPKSFKTGIEIKGVDSYQHPNILIFHAGTKKIGDRLVTNGGRVLNITALGDTLRQARQKAYSLIGKKIKFQQMFYRRDIAKF